MQSPAAQPASVAQPSASAAAFAVTPRRSGRTRLAGRLPLRPGGDIQSRTGQSSTSAAALVSRLCSTVPLVNASILACQGSACRPHFPRDWDAILGPAPAAAAEDEAMPPPLRSCPDGPRLVKVLGMFNMGTNYMEELLALNRLPWVEDRPRSVPAPSCTSYLRVV